MDRRRVREAGERKQDKVASGKAGSWKRQFQEEGGGQLHHLALRPTDNHLPCVDTLIRKKLGFHIPEGATPLC